MTTVKRTGFKPGEIKQQLRALDGFQINVGWFPSATHSITGAPIAGTMAVQEFGSPKLGIPPRAPMRITAEAEKPSWDETLSKLYPRVVAGKMSLQQAATFLGQTVVGDLQKTISRGLPPKLADATLYARKHRKNQPNNSEQPLVDRREAFNTLSFNTERTNTK